VTIFEAIIISVVEGITEFLPISSTGHMIITQNLLGIPATDFVKAFTVNIQFGAILSVIVLYWKRFFQNLQFYYKLAVACLPLVIAYLLEKQIDSMLGSILIVAVSLLIGGFFLLFVDRWFDRPENEKTELTFKKAFLIGLFQIISVIPGVSRSAATIIGGMTQKLSRKNAAEFSFFLAVPTMFAASALKLIENYKVITPDNINLLLIGNIVSFVVAMIAIKAFIGFLTKYGFKLFGYYRIILAIVILILLYVGKIDLTIPS
jgi:undecaprenyl-diphosphatase